MARQTGARPARLDGPTCPPELAYLWGLFAEIHAGRSQNGMGPSRASHLDLAAWQWLTGRRLAGFERRAIHALGGAWLAVMTEKTATIGSPATLPAPPATRKR